MEIRIRLFAQMAQLAGESSFEIQVADGFTVESVRALLVQRFPQVRWPAATLIAVNQDYAAAGRVLRAGDEVAIIPPVSGG